LAFELISCLFALFTQPVISTFKHIVIHLPKIGVF